jgi:glycosyltransferase involved in cell wall biosynthesis
VSASLNEGFGIPLIEAQYFGVPLIVSNIESYREIAGSGADFFDPLNQEAIAQALLKSDQSIRHSGQALSKRDYSWERSASNLAELFSGAMQDQIAPSDEKKAGKIRKNDQP